MRPRVEFYTSAASPDDFVRDALPKVILAGRSNAGKSSLINCLSGVKNLARVSSSPGKTAFANYFSVNGGALWWVDLPGYGYAAVSKGERARWGELMEAFFKQTDGTYRGVLIVDVRIRPTDGDKDMAACFDSFHIPFTVVANKVDKIKPREVAGRMAEIQETLGREALPFSALKGTGRDELLKILT